MELHYIPLIVLVFMLCYLQSGLALKCYFCVVSGPSPDQKCNGTIKNCTSNEPFCNIYTGKGSDNISDFTRDCVRAEVCKPNYCKDTIIGLYGKTECSVACCKDDLCNRDVINIYSSSGKLSMRGLQIVLTVVFPWCIYMSVKSH